MRRGRWATAHIPACLRVTAYSDGIIGPAMSCERPPGAGTTSFRLTRTCASTARRRRNAPPPFARRAVRSTHRCSSTGGLRSRATRSQDGQRNGRADRHLLGRERRPHGVGEYALAWLRAGLLKRPRDDVARQSQRQPAGAAHLDDTRDHGLAARPVRHRRSQSRGRSG